MKSFFLVCICFYFFLVSCKDQSEKAPAFSKKISATIDTVQNGGLDFKQTLTLCLKTNDFTLLSKAHYELLRCIAKSEAEIKQMPDVAGSESLKGATLKFLDFEKQLAYSVVPFLTMNAGTPSDSVAIHLQRLFIKSQDENSYVLEVKAAQLAYARKNGFSSN